MEIFEVTFKYFANSTLYCNVTTLKKRFFRKTILITEEYWLQIESDLSYKQHPIRSKDGKTPNSEKDRVNLSKLMTTSFSVYKSKILNK